MEDNKYNWKVVEDDGEGNIKEMLFKDMMEAYVYFESGNTSRHPKASTTIQITDED